MTPDDPAVVEPDPGALGFGTEQQALLERESSLQPRRWLTFALVVVALAVVALLIGLARGSDEEGETAGADAAAPDPAAGDLTGDSAAA
ncbi:MAG TPA: hypothetical protein DEP69_06050, partial [Acidimicrobiaceae bacterium]|nr:hypothetical protein [Acidimicrobiaceae bacterium]